MDKVIETTVGAQTELKEANKFCDSRLVLSYNGKSTNVSSGSMFGGCQAVDIPDEDPVDVLKDVIRKHNEWLDSYKDEETNTTHRIGLKFKNKATLNGKEIIIDETNNLSKWIK